MELHFSGSAAARRAARYTQSIVEIEEDGRSRDASPLSEESALESLEKAYSTLAPVLREVSERKFRIPPADAEAVVNTVFEVFLRRRARVRDLERYLIASVCNASRDYWRAKSRTEPL